MDLYSRTPSWFVAESLPAFHDDGWLDRPANSAPSTYHEYSSLPRLDAYTNSASRIATPHHQSSFLCWRTNAIPFLNKQCQLPLNPLIVLPGQRRRPLMKIQGIQFLPRLSTKNLWSLLRKLRMLLRTATLVRRLL